VSDQAPGLPTGTVTFLVVDISDWRGLVRSLGDGTADVVDDYERLVGEIVDECGGRIVDASGDTLIGAFTSAVRAAGAAAETQRRVSEHAWPHGADVQLQVGLHTGEPTVGRGRYLGVAVHRALFAAGAAHPGQIVLTSATRALVDRLPDGVSIRDLGRHVVPEFDEPVQLFQLVVDGLPDEFPPPKTQAGGEDGAALPTGTLTLLFTDIENSTLLLRQLRDRWGQAQSEHRRILRAAVAEAGGREVDTQGDSFFFVFARARDALAAAESAQRAVHEHEWPDGVRLRVRMGIHTGEPAVGDEGYLGLDVVRAARICATAGGGQVLVSETTRALLGAHESEDFELRDIGERELKDLPRREHLFELVVAGAPVELVPVARPVSGEVETTDWTVVAREPQLASRLRLAAKALEASIAGQVEAELRAAGLGAEAPDATAARALAVPGVHRKATRAELLFAAFVLTLVAVTILLLVLLVLLVVF
jgi:class 3 adenylate cyclase